MLSVTYKPFMLSLVTLSVVMLSVVPPLGFLFIQGFRPALSKLSGWVFTKPLTIGMPYHNIDLNDRGLLAVTVA